MVESLHGPVRLEVEPPAVPPHQPFVGPPQHRPLHNTPIHSPGEVLQLETRPLGDSSGCILPILDRVQGFCRPPLVYDCQVPEESETGSGNNSHGDSLLEVPALVSNCCSNVHRLSEATSSIQRHNAAHGELSGSQSQDRIGRMAHFRASASNQGFSQEVTNLLGASWREGTHKNYNSAWGKWEDWCLSAEVSPCAASLNDVLSFLMAQFNSGHSYCSINVYRSAISSIHPRIDGYTIGSHPLVSRLLKATFNKRPPLPKYTASWSVGQVLSYLKTLGNNHDLLLKELTFKLVMLVALSTAARSLDLVLLNIESINFVPEGVTCHLVGLSKQSISGHSRSAIEIASFQEDPSICPVECLKVYLEKTHGLCRGSKQLFIGLVKPHKAVKACTISRWIKSTLSSAGIDTNIFRARSTRGAASSSALAGGASL